MQQVDFYYDFSSTNSYFAAFMLPEMAARAGASVRWLPIHSAALFRGTGFDVMAMTPRKARYLWRDHARYAEVTGLPFRRPSRFPIKTALALRCVLAAGRLAAARGEDGRAWPWGEVFDPERCACVESGWGWTAPRWAPVVGCRHRGGGGCGGGPGRGRHRPPWQPCCWRRCCCVAPPGCCWDWPTPARVTPDAHCRRCCGRCRGRWRWRWRSRRWARCCCSPPPAPSCSATTAPEASARSAADPGARVGGLDVWTGGRGPPGGER